MTNKKNGSVFVLCKQAGETPLDALERFRQSRPELAGAAMTYAGRLDPLAEGVLLVLAGDAIGQKEEYLKLEKEYVFEILFGFATDTHDLLGKITDTNDAVPQESDIARVLSGFVGTHEQAYPPYSSKTVGGKPLFMWARESRLHEIIIPVHMVTITELSLLGVSNISKSDLTRRIEEAVGKVTGDFRQHEVLELWKAYLAVAAQDTFVTCRIRMRCGSGTYVRMLVHDIGAKLGVPAVTLHIRRERVGSYTCGEITPV